MKELLEVLRVFISFLFLAVSSCYDLKTREVPNLVWLFFAPIGLVMTLLQLYLGYLAGENVSSIIWLLSFAVTSGISLALFYISFFGGADAKGLICLSIALPVYPSLARRYAEWVTPFFPLAVLSNAVLGSSLLVLGIVSLNMLRLVQTGGKMFEGLESEPFWSKVLAFTTGFKVDLDKLRKGCYYIPLEYFSRGKDGKIIRHLKISPRLEDEDLEKDENWNDLTRGLNEKVWATPGLPFLFFITVGFITALLAGDFITWLVTQLTVFRGV